MTKTGYFVDDPLEMRRLECEYDACDCLVHELLPRMELGELKKMLATLKPFAKNAYKAAMAAREGKVPRTVNGTGHTGPTLHIGHVP